jgi:hypothetical protein
MARETTVRAIPGLLGPVLLGDPLMTPIPNHVEPVPHDPVVPCGPDAG